MSEYNEIDIAERLKTTINSYMSKEEFIKILEEINFIAVESGSLNLITGFLYNKSEDKIEKKVKGIGID